MLCGSSRIRTYGSVNWSIVFRTIAIIHSATLPIILVVCFSVISFLGTIYFRSWTPTSRIFFQLNNPTGSIWCKYLHFFCYFKNFYCFHFIFICGSGRICTYTAIMARVLQTRELTNVQPTQYLKEHYQKQKVPREFNQPRDFQLFYILQNLPI